ncbi:MAG: ABC transporter permease [Clostridiales bacterium]|nr:ABC transporter permease [Clostridiales bacterium]
MEKIIILTRTNMSIFFKNKVLLVITLLLPILFYIFFSLIFTEYEDINRIPIAVLDEDHTILSNDVMTALQNNQSLKVLTTDLKESNRYLKNNRIEAIFVLKKGFESAIQRTDTDGIIKLIYLDKSAIGPALSDIIASDVMMQLAIYKAANQAVFYGDKYGYDNLYDKTVAVGTAFVDESYFNMAIETRIITPNTQLEETINITKILKANTTFGYSIIVFSFILMFSNGYLFENQETNKRLMMSGYKDHHIYFSQLLSIILCGLIIVVIQSVLMTFGMGIIDLTTFVTILITLSLHVVFLANLVLMLSIIVKNKTSYQSIIAPILFLLGLIGGAFWSTELLSKSIAFVSYVSPIYWSLKIMNASILTNQSINSLEILLSYFGFTIILTIISLSIFKQAQHKIRHP